MDPPTDQAPTQLHVWHLADRAVVVSGRRCRSSPSACRSRCRHLPRHRRGSRPLPANRRDSPHGSACRDRRGVDRSAPHPAAIWLRLLAEIDITVRSRVRADVTDNQPRQPDDVVGPRPHVHHCISQMIPRPAAATPQNRLSTKPRVNSAPPPFGPRFGATFAGVREACRRSRLCARRGRRWVRCGRQQAGKVHSAEYEERGATVVRRSSSRTR